MAHFLLWFIGEEVTPWKINMIANNECFDISKFSEEQNSYTCPEEHLKKEELEGWSPRKKLECPNLNGEKLELREKWSKLIVDPLFTPLIIPDRNGYLL